MKRTHLPPGTREHRVTIDGDWCWILSRDLGGEFDAWIDGADGECDGFGTTRAAAVGMVIADLRDTGAAVERGHI